MKPDLCDYTDAYILAQGSIKIIWEGVGAAAGAAVKKIMSK